MTQTTIKVPTHLRERVQAYAQREHLSQATVLEKALDLLDRNEFFARLAKDVVERPEEPVDLAERSAWLAGSVALSDESQLTNESQTTDGTGA